MSDLRDDVAYLICDFKLKELQMSKNLELYKRWGIIIDIALAIISFSSLGALAVWEGELKWVWAVIGFIAQCVSLGKPYLHADLAMSCLDEKSKKAKILVAEAISLYRDLSEMPGYVYKDSQKEECKRLESEASKVFDFDNNVFIFQFFGAPNRWAQKEMRSWATTKLNFKF